MADGLLGYDLDSATLALAAAHYAGLEVPDKQKITGTQGAGEVDQVVAPLVATLALVQAVRELTAVVDKIRTHGIRTDVV